MTILFLLIALAFLVLAFSPGEVVFSNGARAFFLLLNVALFVWWVGYSP